MDSVKGFGNSTNKERTQYSYNNNNKKKGTPTKGIYLTHSVPADCESYH